MQKVRKINARITASVDKKLQEIVRATGSNMSQVIMAAIESFHSRGMASEAIPPYELARQAGIIGCAKGPGDLSKKYKKYLTADLEKKYRRNDQESDDHS
jgi:hypothetical protein